MLKIILIVAVLICSIGWWRSNEKVKSLRARISRRDMTINEYLKTNTTLLSERGAFVAQVKELEKRCSEKELQCNNLIQKLDEVSKEGLNQYGH